MMIAASGAGGLNFKPENTACLLKATCHCQKTLVLPAQMHRGAYRVTFGKREHEKGCDNARSPRPLQADIGKLSPGETKSACNGELFITLP